MNKRCNLTSSSLDYTSMMEANQLTALFNRMKKAQLIQRVNELESLSKITLTREEQRKLSKTAFIKYLMSFIEHHNIANDVYEEYDIIEVASKLNKCHIWKLYRSEKPRRNTLTYQQIWKEAQKHYSELDFSCSCKLQQGAMWFRLANDNRTSRTQSHDISYLVLHNENVPFILLACKDDACLLQLIQVIMDILLTKFVGTTIESSVATHLLERELNELEMVNLAEESTSQTLHSVVLAPEVNGTEMENLCDETLTQSPHKEYQQSINESRKHLENSEVTGESEMTVSDANNAENLEIFGVPTLPTLKSFHVESRLDFVGGKEFNSAMANPMFHFKTTLVGSSVLEGVKELVAAGISKKPVAKFFLDSAASGCNSFVLNKSK